MNILLAPAGLTSLGLLVVIGLVVKRRMPMKLDPRHFVLKWRELQRHCADRKTWPNAVTCADALLDDALKKRRYKGKTLGARLMAAQHELTDNDGIWAAHNVAKKVLEAPKHKLTKTEVRESLEHYQQALIDLGALRRVSK